MTNKTSVFMFLTKSCNLACQHCYVSAEPRLRGHMNLDVFEKSVKWFVKRGVTDFRLTGGEPMINPEFDSMLDALNSKKILPRLLTNGIRLMRMPSPSAVLKKVSKCWISVYGISSEQHRSIGGRRCESLEAILNFAARQTELGHWAGISALLTDVTLETLEEFLSLAEKSGVRYLRFLFGEPSGRAAQTSATFASGRHSRDQAFEIVEYLRRPASENMFDFLSINNPFNLESKHQSGQASCLLTSRRMWSVSPDGGIYSCCFNIYDAAHLTANVSPDGGCREVGDDTNINEVYALRCKALKSDYWGRDYAQMATCPISALTLSTSS